MTLSSLIPLTLLLWVLGYAGCALAQKVRLPRLLGGIALWLALSPLLSLDERFDAGFESAHERLAYETDRAESRAKLARTDVTPAALTEFDAATTVRLAELDDQRTKLQGSADRDLSLALGYPIVAITLGITLWTAPRRPRFARELPFVLAGAITTAGLSLLAGWALFAWGGYGPTSGSPWPWITALALACAVTTRAHNPTQDPLPFPLWSNVFEPTLYALAAFLVDWETFDWVLLLVVFVLFTCVKTKGALLLRRYVAKGSWSESLRLGLSMADAGPAAVAVAIALHATQLIDGPLFLALILTFLLASLAARLTPLFFADADPQEPLGS